LIHGLIGSLNAPKILDSFTESAVFAPDLIGYGAFRDSSTDGLTLEQQADHVALWIRQRTDEPVHLVGHSVGGAIAAFVAARHPYLVKSLTSIEGNFIPADAFWSSRIANLELSEVETILDGYKADVPAWLLAAGVIPTPWTVSVAEQWLGNQPASTIQATAKAVVEATNRLDFLEMMREILASKVQVHLIAGERSRKEWGVPDWVVKGSVSNTDVPKVGHLMMLEDPATFAKVVLSNLCADAGMEVELLRPDATA